MFLFVPLFRYWLPVSAKCNGFVCAFVQVLATGLVRKMTEWYYTQYELTGSRVSAKCNGFVCAFVQVLATGLVRKMMEWYYTQYELKWLDDLLPGKHVEKPEDKEQIIGNVRIVNVM